MLHRHPHKSEAFSQYQSSGSSEEEGGDKSWGHTGWEDTSLKFHPAGWLSKDKKDSWNKSLKESKKREDELVTLTAAAQEKKELKAERQGEVLKS